MKILRITDHKLYHSLTDHGQLCYKRGLPIRYMGHDVKSMVFMDYTVGNEVIHTISAVKQKKWALDYKKALSRNIDTSGSPIISCYSAPTDTAAFECAGAFFEAAVRKGMSCQCVSAAKIAQDMYDIPRNDLYVIYGVTDLPNGHLDRSLTSFLYDRDGSIRIVVMTGGRNTGPWQIAQNQLHIKMDIHLILNDEDERNAGNIERVG